MLFALSPEGSDATGSAMREFDYAARLDLPVFAFAAGLMALVGLGFGLLPALRASRTDLRGAMSVDLTWRNTRPQCAAIAQLIRRHRARDCRCTAHRERYRDAIFPKAGRGAMGLRDERSAGLQRHGSRSILSDCRGKRERARNVAQATAGAAWRQIRQLSFRHHQWTRHGR